MTVYSVGQLLPQIDESAFLAPGCHVAGQVFIGGDSGIWFGVVIRGDNEPIRIGARSNVQENSVMHVDTGHPLTVGDDVTIGHLAMLHGCTIGNGSLIGIKAVVMNGATIGEHSLIGAGALVTEGKQIPPRSLVMGAPGKVVRELTDAEVARLQLSADSYVERARLYRQRLALIPTGASPR
ncbi:MAG: gamma carbonic anhydrase family protein [Burkholderiaceae bacterium]